MDDFKYIRRTLELAEMGAGLTSPGAMVGAVVVKDDRVIGEGFYTYDGLYHAEVLALGEAEQDARGATVYTSLEPCSHQGRTPPCVKALIGAGVHRLRHRCDAVITGSGTFLADKPQLTDRSGLPRRRPLLRIVLDRRNRIQDFDGGLLFRDSLEALVGELYSREIQSFLLECGPDLAFNALRAGIIDKLIVFVAPKILGGREIPAIGGEGMDKLSEAIALEGWTIQTAGPDVMLTAYVHRDH